MFTSVLVVEDNPADFRLLKEALVDVGAFTVKLTGVRTLREAVELAAGTAFNVALLDLSLPDTDGLDGLSALQAAAPELPILVLTGRNDSELAVRAVREGAQDYLVKGQFNGHLLLRAMRYAEERQRSLRELERSEQRFRSLLENALDIIMVIGLDGAVSYSSPSVERVLGYGPDQLTGTRAFDYVHPQDVFAVMGALQAAAGRGTQTVECRVRCRSGEYRVLEAMGRRMDDPASDGIVINARDITERKLGEEQLRDANARLEAVIETSPLAIYVLDFEGRVQSWNTAAERIFGWPEAEVLNRPLPVINDFARNSFEDSLDRARAGQSVPHYQSRYKRKDGSRIDVSVWTALLRNDSGAVTGVLRLVADVTEQRHLEDQFRQAQKMEAVGRLAGGVAHDFNNLLTVITGYGQLAANRVDPDSPVGIELREVLGASERAASLTRQLLALSRHQVVESVILNLNSVVSDLERMLHRIIGEDVELVTRLDPSLTSIRADRGQIELVLLNLAINARDAMPSGGVLTIETGNVLLDPEDVPARRVPGVTGPCVMLAVTDNGIGMNPSVRAQIFEPFFTTKEAGKGTGLGLSTSYGVVRQHGGDIWVYTEEGVGTTFKVYFPSAGNVNAQPQSQTTAPTQSRGHETILVVEDDPTVAAVIRDTLTLKGYDVLLTTEPAQALEIVRTGNKTIHLLLSDMVLHGMHGVDLARQVRTLRPGLPVLFVSGYTGTAAPGQPFLETGFAFLQKPFSPDTLAAKVRKVLSEGIQEASGSSLSVPPE